jgi:PAS domain S-box-containing protein
MYNALLQQQIREHLNDAGEIPERFGALLRAVSESYDTFESDREAIDREVIDREASIDEPFNPGAREDVATDLDRRVDLRAAQELQYRTSRLAALMENLQAGVLVEDEEERIIVINQSFCDMFGIEHTPQELVGAASSGMAEGVKSLLLDPESFMARIRELMARRERTIGDVLRLVDGRTFERDYIPIIVDGEYRGHLWQCRDVTGTRHAQEAIELLNEELRKANQLLTIERERDKELMARLEEVNQMKSEFVSSVSHELRTPLASILGFAQTILMDPDLPADMRGEFLQIILEEGRRLAKLINDVLDLARIESGRVILEKNACDLVPIIKRAVQAVLMQAELKSLALEVDLSESSIIARVDADRMQQVLVNLLGNAVKFTPAGGAIELRAGVRDGEVVIDVSDTGLGIPADDIPRLFEKFFRVHRPGLDIRGTGLGLAIAKHSVELHGGILTVQSEEHRGSTFTIRFPQS